MVPQDGIQDGTCERARRRVRASGLGSDEEMTASGRDARPGKTTV